MSALQAPQPDRAAILATLGKLFATDDVVELRAFPKGGKKRTDAGYLTLRTGQT